MPPESPELPPISVLLPIFNEERYVEECLTSVRNQDYPPDRMEILVVDGMSTDATREIVTRLAEQDPRIKLLDNPKRCTSPALNVGIRAASTDIIVRVDGHWAVAADYCRESVECLLRTKADCVGGPKQARGRTFWGRAIALAACSPVGVGVTSHFAAEEGWVEDTVHGCTYPRPVFDRVGYFKEDWRCDEDDELNFRIRKAGGRVYYSPKIQMHYYTRNTLWPLFRQYFRFGYWKVRVFQEHPTKMKLRHVIPTLFALGLVGSGVLGLFFWPFALLFWLVAGSYLLLLLAASASIALKNGWWNVFTLPVVFSILHVSYGAGFLAGLVAFAGKRGKKESG